MGKLKEIESFLSSLSCEIVMKTMKSFFSVTIPKRRSFFLDGKKGTVFRFNTKISIVAGEFQIDIRLELDGEGDFCGHIFQGNRPGQITRKGAISEAYDWCIALRTLRRKGPCKITATFDINAKKPSCEDAKKNDL